MSESDRNLDFIRHWSEVAYDRAQLAQIAVIEEHVVAYAMTAWRDLDIPPPIGVLLLCTVEEPPGVLLMTKSQGGDWRTSSGHPHRPPKAWMPCPPPRPNGK